MKKIILFIALMITSLSLAQTSKAEINKIIKKQSDGIITSSQKGVSTVYNDGISVVKTVYNDAKSLSPKIESAIKSLATEFKTTTNALWDILVRQQLVWSIGFLILTLTSIFNWYLFYERNLNSNLKYLHLIICISLSGLSVYHFGDMLTGFINPEFGALKIIAEMAIKLK